MLASTPNLLQMCSFDATKSTKGASKLRRDLINAEIANLRDLLPLPSSTRQRLSQLQLMALVCVYVRKANYFQHAFRKHDLTPEVPMPHFGFSKALNGFLMMMTQNGKLLYISDNAAEYLGHSMEDLLIHGDSVYDIIEKQDHQTIQAELIRSSNPLSLTPDKRLFLCRMNVSRNARRQMRFGDQKVVLVEGHFVSFLPLCSRNEPVFLATCTPVAMPETRECVVQGSTNVFTSIHSMDMKYLHIDRNGEFHLGHTKGNIQGMSWYDLVHWDNLREAQSKHRLITQSEQERSCILLLRLKTNANQWIWVHIVLQVKDSNDTSQQPVIVCTNQVLSEKEALVMRANSWLYQFYSLHSKMHYSLAYDAHTSRLPGYYPPAAPASAVMAHSYHHPTGVTAGPETANVPLHPVQPLSPYSHIHTAIAPLNGTPNHHHPHHPTPVLQYSPQAGSLPYSSFVPVNASPIAESECNRQANQTAKRTLTPPHHDHQEEQPQQDEETETTEPNTKRPNHGHHLPPPPSSTYHHPRASSFGYPTSMFGAGGFSSISGVTELGTVVPVSGYYSGHQMLTSVPYHHQIGHHFRNQNKLSLFDHDGDSGELEQSLTPTNTEEVSNMISMTASSPPSFFKYPPSSITLANQYYSVAGQYLDVEKHTSKSPQSITSDYGSGTSSPPSAFEKPKKDGTDYGDHFIVSGSGGIQQQMYQTLRSWNNYPIYTDLSSSKPMRGSPVHQFRGRDGDTNSLRVCSDNTTSHLGGSNHRLVYSNGDHTVGFNDNSGISHLVSSQANPVIAMPLTAAMSETLSPPLSIAQLSVTGTPVQASSRSPSSSSEAGDPNPSSCGVGRAPGYDGGGGGGVGGATAAGTRRGASSKRSQDRNEEQTSRSQNSCNSE